MSPKQVIVVRTRFPDGKGGYFGMRTGKLAAQVAHASMKVFFDRGSVQISEDPDGNLPDEFWLNLPITTAMREWVEGTFTKVVVGVETEEDLLRCHELAKERGLPTALIQDMGATEFKASCSACEGHGRVGEGCPAPLTLSTKHFGAGVAKCENCNGTGKVSVPTYTTVALGPADSAHINEITGPEGLVRVKLL